jgi:hypothetical protein
VYINMRACLKSHGLILITCFSLSHEERVYRENGVIYAVEELSSRAVTVGKIHSLRLP